MKLNSDNNIDNNYSLNNLDNYNKVLKENSYDVINKFCELLNNFLNIIFENLKIKKNIYSKFIIVRGVETIISVFNILLYNTKNLDLTYYHCQKSCYYYVEFIQQITEEQHIFLQLSSRDASTYVYKKNIFDINPDIMKNMPVINKELKNKLDLVGKHINVLKYIFEIILQNCNLEKETLENKISLIKKFGIVNKNLIALKLDFNSLDIFYKVIQILDNLNEKDINPETYLDHVISLLQKCSKNTNKNLSVIKKNIYNIDLELISLNEFVSFITKMKD